MLAYLWTTRSRVKNISCYFCGKGILWYGWTRLKLKRSQNWPILTRHESSFSEQQNKKHSLQPKTLKNSRDRKSILLLKRRLETGLCKRLKRKSGYEKDYYYGHLRSETSKTLLASLRKPVLTISKPEKSLTTTLRFFLKSSSMKVTNGFKFMILLPACTVRAQGKHPSPSLKWGHYHYLSL